MLLWNAVYIVLEMIMALQLCKLTRSLCGKNARNKKVEFLSYVVITLLEIILYKVISIPIITLSIGLISSYLLTLNYQVENIKRVMTVFVLYFTLAVAETITILFTHYTVGSIFQKVELPPNIAYVMYALLACLILEIMCRVRKKSQGKISPHIFLVTIVTDTIMIFYICITLGDGNHKMQVLILGIFFFLYNFSMIYLHDIVALLIKQKAEKLILLEENRSFQKQIEIMSMHTQNNDTFRHAFKNNIILIKHMVEGNENTEALKQLDSFGDLLDDEKNIKTGVHIVDSILNFKLFEARYRGIEVDYKMAIPVDISYDEFDMTIIIGNLMDFVIQQTRNAKAEKPQIFVSLRFEIDLEGSGWLKIQTKHPLSKHPVIPENEQTLKHVTKTVKQYEGYIGYDAEDDMFKINITMLLLTPQSRKK